MILQYYRSFRTDYERLPKDTQSLVDKAILLLETNPRHPSLQVKKMKGPKHVWEGRASISCRFTFEWEGNVITLRRVGSHDTLKKESP